MKKERKFIPKYNLYFQFINPILNTFILTSLIVFSLSLFPPIAFFLISLFGEFSIYIYPIFAYVLTITISIKTLSILLLFKLRGDYIEDFLLLNFLVAVFLYLNDYSQPTFNFILQLSIRSINIVESLILIINRLTTVVSQNVLATLTFQFPQSIDNLGPSNLLWLLSRLNAIFILISLSFLTIKFFLDNTTLRIRMIFRKMYKNRYIIFTDESPENVLDLIRNMKKNYLRIYIDEENEFTKVGQDYKKRLESNGLHVISIGREEKVIRGIFYSHIVRFNPLGLKNLYVSYYKNINENRNFIKNFNSLFEKINADMRESKNKISNFFKTFSESDFYRNSDNSFNHETHKKKNLLINSFSNVIDVFLHNRLVSLNNQTNPKTNYLLSSNQSEVLLQSMINPKYITAYLFVYDFINDLLPTIQNYRFNQLNIIFVGNNSTNYFLRQILSSLVSTMNLKVKIDDFSYRNQDNYYSDGDIIQDKVDSIFDKFKFDISEKNLTLFLIDNLNANVNESISNYLANKIKEKQKNLDKNKSIFLIYYKHDGYNSPLSRDFLKIRNFINNLDKEDEDAKENAIDNFVPIQTISMKSNLSEIDYFIFEVNKYILASYLSENFNSLPFSYLQMDDSLNNKELKDKSWAALYYFLFDKKLEGGDEKYLERLNYERREALIRSIKESSTKEFKNKTKLKKQDLVSYWDNAITEFIKEISFSKVFAVDLMNSYFNKPKTIFGFGNKVQNISIFYGLVNFNTISSFDETYYYYEKLLFDNIQISTDEISPNNSFKEEPFTISSMVSENNSKFVKQIVEKIDLVLNHYLHWIEHHFADEPWSYKKTNQESFSFLSLNNGRMFDTESKTVINCDTETYKALLYKSLNFNNGRKEFTVLETKNFLMILGPIIYRFTHRKIFDRLIKSKVKFHVD
jgi:hypothetical protein